MDLEKGVILEVVLESGGKTRMVNLFVKYSRSTAEFQSYGVSVTSWEGFSLQRLTEKQLYDVFRNE